MKYADKIANHKLTFITITESDITTGTQLDKNPCIIAMKKEHITGVKVTFVSSNRLMVEYLKWLTTGEFTPGKYGVWIRN